MNTGIEREEALSVMAEMIQRLELADTVLLDTMKDLREGLFLEQSGRVAEFAASVEQIEKVSDAQSVNSHLVKDFQDGAGLKLELGF